MNKNETKWMELFETAKKYYEANGDLLVPTTYQAVNGAKLGTWIANQRKSFKKAKLSKEQIGLLESVGMVWDTSKKAESDWFKYYEVAKEYYEKHGNLDIHSVQA